MARFTYFLFFAAPDSIFHYRSSCTCEPEWIFSFYELKDVCSHTCFRTCIDPRVVFKVVPSIALWPCAKAVSFRGQDEDVVNHYFSATTGLNPIINSFFPCLRQHACHRIRRYNNNVYVSVLLLHLQDPQKRAFTILYKNENIP